MQTESIKQQAHRLLDDLPETATWDDLMYRIYVRQAIEAGIKDKAMLQRLMEIEALDTEDQKTIVHALDSLIREAKARNTYGAQG